MRSASVESFVSCVTTPDDTTRRVLRNPLSPCTGGGRYHVFRKVPREHRSRPTQTPAIFAVGGVVQRCPTPATQGRACSRQKRHTFRIFLLHDLQGRDGHERLPAG